MYNVAANFHTLAIQDAPKTRVRIYFIDDTVDCTDDNDVQTNGTLLVGAAGDTDSNGRIAEGGITFQEFFNPEKNVMIGDCVSSQIEMTLLNFDGALDGFAFGRCKVYLDVYDTANSVWLPCPMGVYLIEQPTKTKQKLIVANGFDQMQKLDASADSWWSAIDWTSGVSFLQLINSLAAEVGVSVSTNTASAIENSGASFGFAVTDCNGVTFRQVLGLIGEATATTARFDRDGALDMRWFKAAKISGNTVTINTDTIGNQCLSIDIAEYSVAQYGRLKYKIGSFSATAGIGNGDNIYYIVDNPFLNPQLPDGMGGFGLNNVVIQIYKLGAYYPIQGKFIMDWSIESGDIINIIRNSTTYSMPIYQQKMTWRGGFVVSDASNDGDPIRPEWSTRSNEEFPIYSEKTRRCEETISAVGWYRIIRMDYGIHAVDNPTGSACPIFDINIVRDKFENHTIQYRGGYNTDGLFCNERSKSRTPLGIDKIRFIYANSGTQAGPAYIDIHCSSSYSALVSVFYNVYVKTGRQVTTFSVPLEPVADTPAGETVQSEYTFARTGAVESLPFGDTTFNGAIDITQRRCSATLSSAGWYRVLQTVDNAGEVFSFEICRKAISNNNETHTIDYHMDYGGKNYFLNETSVSGNLYIDAIRYTYDNSYGYIDIHYNSATASEVFVHFFATGCNDTNANTVAMGLASVADAPIGETVQATYDFVLNTDDSATVSVGSDANDIVVSGTKLYKHGKIVTGFVKVNTKSISAGGWRNMAVIPSGFRPPYDIDFAGINNSEDTFVHARIFASSGNISIWPTSAIASGKYIYISFTYHTDE